MKTKYQHTSKLLSETIIQKHFKFFAGTVIVLRGNMESVRTMFRILATAMKPISTNYGRTFS